ncbi:MAG: hypothetical protein A4E60_03552 [Syntrophorhabdus sp. PtaB.Bin047]|nr:MAG: hypothetical protein A4E60_03552 [Syntrophorhabdus sp. PtaB.Bin047]
MLLEVSLKLLVGPLQVSYLLRASLDVPVDSRVLLLEPLRLLGKRPNGCFGAFPVVAHGFEHVHLSLYLDRDGVPCRLRRFMLLLQSCQCLPELGHGGLYRGLFLFPSAAIHDKRLERPGAGLVGRLRHGLKRLQPVGCAFPLCFRHEKVLLKRPYPSFLSLAGSAGGTALRVTGLEARFHSREGAAVALHVGREGLQLFLELQFLPELSHVDLLRGPSAQDDAARVDIDIVIDEYPFFSGSDPREGFIDVRYPGDLHLDIVPGLSEYSFRGKEHAVAFPLPHGRGQGLHGIAPYNLVFELFGEEPFQRLDPRLFHPDKVDEPVFRAYRVLGALDVPAKLFEEFFLDPFLAPRALGDGLESLHLLQHALALVCSGRFPGGQGFLFPERHLQRVVKGPALCVEGRKECLELLHLGRLALHPLPSLLGLPLDLRYPVACLRESAH